MKYFYDGFCDDIKSILLAQVRDLWTHTSTAIEGNRLTLGDTSFILGEGLTVSGKPLKDHQEVYGHARAIELMYRLLERDTVSEGDLFDLHRAVLSECIMDIYNPVGAWKSESNYTSFVSLHGKMMMREYPLPQYIPGLMSQWLLKLNAAFKEGASREAVIRAYADLHLTFVTIHPFFDGNGRMARLLANLPILKAGYPPVVVPVSDKQRYTKTISAYQEGVLELSSLSNIDALPAGSRFCELCDEYWIETMDLVDRATQLQAARDSSPRVV